MAFRSTVCIDFSDGTRFDCQDLTLVSRCSQLSVVWLPAAGTPLAQVGPGVETAWR